MRKDKVLWVTVLVVSVILLIGFGIGTYLFFRNGSFNEYSQRYYGRGMMRGGYNYGRNQTYNSKKLSVDQIKSGVNEYINSYNGNLKISDIFIYKDTDYYVSIEERDTGRGAMELLVNPYTGEPYPEYGPNMMWNEKYGMHGGYGMMGPGRRNMMYGSPPYDGRGYYGNRDNSRRFSREEAVNIASEYVRSNIGNEFSVPGDGHEFYGYYTFHIENSNKTAGMLSVNYYTGDVWYHNWHGELVEIISDHKE